MRNLCKVFFSMYDLTFVHIELSPFLYEKTIFSSSDTSFLLSVSFSQFNLLLKLHSQLKPNFAGMMFRRSYIYIIYSFLFLSDQYTKKCFLLKLLYQLEPSFAGIMFGRFSVKYSQLCYKHGLDLGNCFFSNCNF